MNSYSSISDIREELPNGHSEEFEDDRLQTFKRRAAAVVATRLETNSNTYPDDLLGDIETLVAAHFAFPAITDADTGQILSSERLGEAQRSYQTTSSAPGDYESPYWDQAVMLAPKLKEEPEESWHVTVNRYS